MQGVALARFAVGHRGRDFHPLELLLRLVRVAGVGADVGAGEQRVHAGDAAQADARAHHPVARVLGGERLRALVQRHRHQHVAAVAAEADLVHLADHHVLVLHRRLALGQALRALEADRDVGAGLQPAAHHQRHAHDRRQDRHQPDQRGVRAPLAQHRARQGVAVRRRRCGGLLVSHRNLPCRPRSAWGRNTSRRTWSAPR